MKTYGMRGGMMQGARPVGMSVATALSTSALTYCIRDGGEHLSYVLRINPFVSRRAKETLQQVHEQFPETSLRLEDDGNLGQDEWELTGA